MTAMALRQSMRALVTRPRGEAEALAATLAARGIGAVIEPLIEVNYRSGAPLDLGGVQAVLCTSANGVRALARVSRERGLPLLAVGDATAACARTESFLQVASAGGAVGDLVRLAAARLRPDGGRLLHISGVAVAGNLAGDLRACGFAVEQAVLYEATPVSSLSAATTQALRAGMVDFALFFSPRTAAVFARLVNAAGMANALAGTAACSISAAADAALAGLPWRARHIAAGPTQNELLAALDRAAAERQTA